MTGSVTRRHLFSREWLVAASLRQKVDDLALAGHVHCRMLTNQAEQKAAGDKISLYEEYRKFIRAAWPWKGLAWADDIFIQHAHREFGLSEIMHCQHCGILPEILHDQAGDPLEGLDAGDTRVSFIGSFINHLTGDPWGR